MDTTFLIALVLVGWLVGCFIAWPYVPAKLKGYLIIPVLLFLGAIAMLGRRGRKQPRPIKRADTLREEANITRLNAEAEAKRAEFRIVDATTSEDLATLWNDGREDS